MQSMLLRSVHGGMLVCLFLVSVELTSRLEDRLRYGTPLLSSPDFDRDLFIIAQDGERIGKPNGRYQKYSMNQMGFRGPDVELASSKNRVQIMLLGSSETFGMYESRGKDYPAQLRERLTAVGDFQVINTSLPGMSAGAVRKTLDERLRLLRPDFVVIYLSPLFDLNLSIRSPTAATTERPTVALPKAVTASTSDAESAFRLRSFERLKDAVEKPAFLQRRIDDKVIAHKRAQLGPKSVFASVPIEIVEQHIADLTAIVRSIRERGGEPILMTHAIRVGTPPSDQDFRVLESFIKNTPRATPEILLEYEASVRQRVIDLGAQEKVVVLDLAKHLSDFRKGFGDLVHFSDEGASIVASLVADEIIRLTQAQVSSMN